MLSLKKNIENEKKKLSLLDDKTRKQYQIFSRVSFVLVLFAFLLLTIILVTCVATEPSMLSLFFVAVFGLVAGLFIAFAYACELTLNTIVSNELIKRSEVKNG